MKDAFIHFENFVETEYNAKIRKFQSDGGTEFKALTQFFSDYSGIHHQISCPYTPEQNDPAERKHRDIVEKGLAILTHSAVPTTHWDDAFVAVVHLINRTPSKQHHSKSPFEILTKKKPIFL